MSANQNVNEQETLVLREGSDEHTMVKLADFIGDKIAVKRGDKTLPWTGKNVEEAKARYESIRAYVYTIYRLNATVGEVDTFNGAKLEKWRVLPLFSDLVAPQAVRYDLNSQYEDLLNRGLWILDGKYFGRNTENGHIMSLDEFNDFTDWVQNVFNIAAGDIKRFSDLRTEVTLASVIERVAYQGETTGYGFVPLQLSIKLHKQGRLKSSIDDVMEDWVRDTVDDKYTKQKRNSSNENK